MVSWDKLKCAAGLAALHTCLHSLPFRDGSGSENSPLLGIRVSPSGAYLLLVFKSGPAELWTTLLTATTAAAAGSSQPTSRAASRLSLASLAAGPAVADAAAGPVAGGAGCLAKPWRMRLLDLPFSAVEWLAAQEDLQTVRARTAYTALPLGTKQL